MNEVDTATEMVLYDAEMQCDGEQLAFIRAMCAASLNVSDNGAKLCARVLAIAAFGGEEKMESLLRVLVSWAQLEKGSE